VGEVAKLSGEAEWKMGGELKGEEEEEDAMKEAGRRPINFLASAIPPSISLPPALPGRGGRYRPLGLRLAESRSEEEGEGKKGEEMTSLLCRLWCLLKEGEGRKEGGECPLRWRPWPGPSSGSMLWLLLMLLLLPSRERARSSGMKLSEMEEDPLWCWLLLLLMLVRDWVREREGGENTVKAEEEGGEEGLEEGAAEEGRRWWWWEAWTGDVTLTEVGERGSTSRERRDVIERGKGGERGRWLVPS